jgi:hypothetical protein
MTYVLDACAMIALLLREPGEEVVWVHLLEKDASCVAHSLNLCEVFYDFYRDSGEAAASEAIDDLRWLGVVERNDLDEVDLRLAMKPRDGAALTRLVRRRKRFHRKLPKVTQRRTHDENRTSISGAPLSNE